MRIKAALAGGLGLIAVAVAVTLAHAPTTTVLSRSTSGAKTLASTTSDAGGCQSGEVLPRDTSAIRLGLFAVTIPAVTVRVLQGSHRITGGTLGVDWSGEGPTVPVARLPRTVSPVEVCFTLKSVASVVELLGRKTPAAEAAIGEGMPLPGRIGIEYLRSGHRSWWSVAVSVARHLGFGHAASGAWDALLVIALAATFITLSSWLVVRELR